MYIYYNLTHFGTMFHLRTNQVVGFTSKMFEKHLWKSDILSKDVTLPQVFFKHFASKNQLPGFYISETLVENGLSCTSFFNKTIKWQIKIIKATITEVILSSGG